MQMYKEKEIESWKLLQNNLKLVLLKILENRKSKNSNSSEKVDQTENQVFPVIEKELKKTEYVVNTEDESKKSKLFTNVYNKIKVISNRTKVIFDSNYIDLKNSNSKMYMLFFEEKLLKMVLTLNLSIVI